VPIAKFMLMTYFAKKDGQPLPTLESAGITVPKPPASTATASPGRSGGGQR
jgi:hypothetical protein